MKKRVYKGLLALVLAVLLAVPASVCAWTGNGIANNGTGGITIDIYSPPYTTYANKPYGQYAYGPSGCAWFASARACQLTGKDTPIWSGQSWWDSAYSYYGYTRGYTPQAKALVCYTGHVAVIEAVYADGTILISEGGNTSFAGNDYCVIRTRTRAAVESNGFLGYVYLGVGGNTNTNTMVDFGNFYGFIYNSYSDMVLTTSTKGAWGNVYMSPYTGAKRQLWRFEKGADGYYTIYSVYDGTCFDVGDAVTTNGANLTTNTPSGHNAQKFYFVKSGDSYVIHTKLCSTVVDIRGDVKPYDGINVQMWTPTNSANQQFILYEALDPYPGLKNYGDVNLDDKVDATDALLVLRYAVGKLSLDTVYHEIANVNGDTAIDTKDALMILKKTVGKLDKFPPEPN